MGKRGQVFDQLRATTLQDFTSVSTTKCQRAGERSGVDNPGYPRFVAESAAVPSC
jgi:hypothetical protein